ISNGISSVPCRESNGTTQRPRILTGFSTPSNSKRLGTLLDCDSVEWCAREDVNLFRPFVSFRDSVFDPINTRDFSCHQSHPYARFYNLINRTTPPPSTGRRSRPVSHH